MTLSDSVITTVKERIIIRLSILTIVMQNISQTDSLYLNIDRKKGREAQQIMMRSSLAVAEAVRTTFGPRGMDKLILGKAEDNITSDAMTIINEMNIEHPVADLIAELALSQGRIHSDGATTAVILASQLLVEAEQLFEQGIHPNSITRGYTLAAQETHNIIDKGAKSITKHDTETLVNIAQTNINGNLHKHNNKFAGLIVKAVQAIEQPERINTDLIKVKSVVSSADSEVFEGMILEREPAHPEMPKSVENASITLIDTSLENKDNSQLTNSPTITLKGAKMTERFLDADVNRLQKMANEIEKTGAKVVVCQTGISDRMKHELLKRDIFAVEYVVERNMQRLAWITGARLMSDIDELSRDDLGKIARITQRTIGAGEFNYLFFEPSSGEALSFILCGDSVEIKREIKRGIENGFSTIKTAIQDGEVVPGGGATEIEISISLTQYAREVNGREQLAVEAFAKALEIVPKTLAENAGLDVIDTMTELRSRHNQNEITAGVTNTTGISSDVTSEGIIEPKSVKTSAIMNATNVVNLLISVDGIYTSQKFIDKMSAKQS